MKYIKSAIRWFFDTAEALLGLAFPANWNPMLNLGALGFFFYWIITASGIYVYVFFDTGVHHAYSSIEYMTNEQWYLAGIMRSLHRYASDGLIIVVMLHIAREFALDRYRGVRWFSWATGVPVMMLIFVAGISGYWLVWDKLAQYVAIVSTEWLDVLPIFGEPIARNFMSTAALESRFFTLMIFMHIAVPLIALALMWMHLQRVTKPRINPPRGLAIGAFLSMLGLSLVYPATSHAPADLSQVPGDVALDWFYLPLFPLLENLPGPVTWAACATLVLIMAVMPWLPPLKKAAPAVVDLANCNGCARCFNDCPYNAISLVARSDGLAFEREPVVDPQYCVSCGICAGSCPTSMPFRRVSALSPGIDMPDRTMADIRQNVLDVSETLEGSGRIMVFGCTSAMQIDKLKSSKFGIIKLNCIGQLPPAFVDYVLSRNLADGVVLTGCRENSCHARYGVRWTQDRLARVRDPQLRNRVPRERVKTLWAGCSGGKKLAATIEEFSAELAQMGPVDMKRRAKPVPDPMLESADA